MQVRTPEGLLKTWRKATRQYPFDFHVGPHRIVHARNVLVSGMCRIHLGSRQVECSAGELAWEQGSDRASCPKLRTQCMCNFEHFTVSLPALLDSRLQVMAVREQQEVQIALDSMDAQLDTNAT